MAGKKVAVSCVLAGALFVVAILLLQGFFLGDGGPVVSPPPGGEVPGGEPGSPAAADVGDSEQGVADASEKDPSEEGTAGVVPEGPLSLEGKVTAETGEGIEGARVMALDVRSWREVFSGIERRFQGNPLEGIKYLRESFLEAGRTVPSARTDPEGKYGFRELPPGERRVLVSHPDHLARSDSWVILEEGKTARCDISLVEGFRISGRVVDEQGAGVAGATVRVTASESRDVQGIGQMIQLIVSLAEADVLLTPGDTVTAKDGSFSMGSLAPVPHDIEVAKKGYIPELSRKIPAGTSDVVLAIRKGLTLRGRILTPGGEPVRGADIRLAEAQAQLDFDNPMVFQEFGDLLADRTLRARTADEGTFELVGAEEGSRELRIQAEGFPEFRQPLEVRESSRDLGEIRLPEPASIAGRVVDPSGVGVAGARVSVSKPDPRRMPGARAEKAAECDTDQDGYFVLGGLEAGSFNTRAIHEERGEAVLAAVETGRRDVILKLEEGYAVQGRVLDDETDTPLPDVKVQTLDGSRSTHTDAEGEFLLRGITKESTQRFGGNVLLRARHRDFEPGSAHLTFGETKPVEIRLKVATGIEGRVVDVEGNPVQGARIWMEVPGVPMSLFLMDPQSAVEAAYSDAEGSFFLRAPQSGRRMALDIVAVRTGTGRVRAALPERTEEGVWPLVEMVLEPGLTLKGRIVDSDGVPVPRARVTVSRVVEEISPEFQMVAAMIPPGRGDSTYSSKDGNYELHELDPGAYKLLASAKGYAKQIVEGVQVFADGASQDVVLEAGGSISGRVVDFEGMPLSGIEVLAFIEKAPPEGDQARGMYEVTRVLQNTSGSGIAKTRTDEGGSFSLTHLPDGVFRTVARAAGFEVGEVRHITPGDPVEDIVLVPFARVVGRVIEAERRVPVPDFRVNLHRVPQEGEEEAPRFAGSLLDKSFQNPDGEYLMENIRAGRYEVRISSEGYAPFDKVVQVDPGREVAVDAILRLGAEITGVARSAGDGQPLGGIHVYVHKVREQGSSGSRRQDMRNTQTAEDGTFSIRGLGDGAYNAGFSSEDWYSEEGHASVQFRIPSEEPLHFEVNFLPAGKVAGKITGVQFDEETRYYHLTLIREEEGEDGKVSSGRRFIAGVYGGRTRSLQAPSPGSFSLGGLPPGTYRVEFSNPFNTAGSSGQEQPPPQVLGTLEVRASETTPFEATVAR